jgi:diguanylate cyclase (GGDEF)-like protein/PAS domain S-box-containing protein
VPAAPEALAGAPADDPVDAPVDAPAGAPADADRPEADAAPPPGPAETLVAGVAGYPGPAFLLDLEEGIQAVSDAALWLLDQLGEAPWWQGLIEWMLAADPPTPPQHSTTVDSPRGQLILEWQAVRLYGRYVVLLGRDVTADRNLRGALAESRKRFRDLVELAADFAWETDAQGRFVYVSPPGALGYPASDLAGTPANALLAIDDAMVDSPFVATRPMAETELWLRRSDGAIASVVAWARPILDDADVFQGVRGLCRDVTDDRQRDLALSRARNRERATAHIVHAMTRHREPVDGLRAALRALRNAAGGAGAVLCPVEPLAGARGRGLIASSPDGAVLDRAEALFAAGLAETAATAAPKPVVGEIEGGPVLAAAVHYADRPIGTLALWRPAERGAWGDEDLELVGMLASQFGITLTTAGLFERLRYQAERDALTGLYNRGAIMEHLTNGLAIAAADGRPASLLYIDLDNFKAVNDVCGHQQGDEVLGELSRLLHDSASDADLAGRMGGDEFLLWLDGRDTAGAEAIAGGLIDGIREIGRRLSASPDKPLGLSIGIAPLYPGESLTAADLIGRSDRAMYRAKQIGKSAGAGGFHFVDAGEDVG